MEDEISPMDISYYDNMEISEINDFIQMLIQDLKFEAVPVARQAIKNKQINQKIIAKDSIEQEYKEVVVTAKDTFEESKVQVEKNYKQLEIDIREKIDDKFLKMKEIHIEQIVELEKRFAYEIIKSQEKPVKEQLDLEDQARKIARDGDIEVAIKYRKRAEEMKIRILDERRAVIEGIYNEKRSQMRQKQQRELQILQDKLIKKLDALELSKSSDIVEREKALNVTLHAAEQKRNIKLHDYAK